jgi:hypothetical protein
MATTNPYDPNAGGSNPYLGAQANAITQQANQNLQLNQLPSIASGAVAAGGFGGSRQGVAEGVATGLTNQGLTNSLANLYGNQYQNDQQNQIARQQVSNNYNLGLGGLGVQAQIGQNNFYTQQRGLDQSGAQLGANLFNQGDAGYIGQGSGITGIGNTVQQAPWNVTQNAGNVFSQFSGLGGSQTSSLSGSALGGALGGGLAGAQIVNNLGLGRSTYVSPYAGQGLSQDQVNYGNLENQTYGGG